MSRVLKNCENQITCKYGVLDYKGHSHLGVDLVGKGSKLDYIIAHDDGMVILAQSGRTHNPNSKGNETYGNMVKIKHNGYYTLYAHMQYISVNLADKVKKGQVIGYMGNSGNANGAHLHFEVFDENNKRVDPEPYINADYNNNKGYSIGLYQVTAEPYLNVRTEPTIASRIKLSRELTPNARLQNKNLGNEAINGLLKGVYITVSEIRGNWGKIPSGWVCLDFCKKA